MKVIEKNIPVVVLVNEDGTELTYIFKTDWTKAGEREIFFVLKENGPKGNVDIAIPNITDIQRNYGVEIADTVRKLLL